MVSVIYILKYQVSDGGMETWEVPIKAYTNLHTAETTCLYLIEMNQALQDFDKEVQKRHTPSAIEPYRSWVKSQIEQNFWEAAHQSLRCKFAEVYHTFPCNTRYDQHRKFNRVDDFIVEEIMLDES